MNNVQQVKTYSQRKISDFLFILWAGGAALLSYSLVYALRKPYTAAGFDGLEAFGMDYKVVVTIAQILGYVLSKFIGIKLISELKRENRMKFILISIILAEASLILFGLLPAPYNIGAMFLNGLSLGCMWGIIFSFIEGRRMTDILTSLLGVSMVISFGYRQVGRFVCHGHFEHQRILDACPDRRSCPSSTCLVGICTQPASTANSRRHCHEIETGNTERQATMGAI